MCNCNGIDVTETLPEAKVSFRMMYGLDKVLLCHPSIIAVILLSKSSIVLSI